MKISARVTRQKPLSRDIREAVTKSLSRRAITLVEMLTVIVVISILLALLMPALNSAREASRQTNCSSNLRQIGVALLAHAQAHKGLLCTGAFDWQRDGSVTSIGWVADLVRSGTPVGQMLCPSNEALLSETYNDLLNLDVSSWASEQPGNPSTWTCGINHKGRVPETLPDGTQRRDPCEQIISTESLQTPGAARDELVFQAIFRQHFNTNYTASWYLVRTGVKLGSDGNLQGLGGGCETSPLARACTFGPLHLDRLSSVDVSSSFIPLLGDGRVSQYLERAFGDFKQSIPLVLAYTRGPVVNPSMDYLTVPPNTAREGPNGWWALWNRTLQDYRGFAPLHRGFANILMADGSVRSWKDENNDAYLNNGFQADPANGFADSTVELPPEDFVSVPSLSRF